MDWRSIIESLRTDSIISYLTASDPLYYLQQPWVIGGLLVVGGAMIFLKMIRSLFFLIGMIALWFDIAYFLPDRSTGELHLMDLGPFVGIMVLVSIVWIYVFFIRSD